MKIVSGHQVSEWKTLCLTSKIIFKLIFRQCEDEDLLYHGNKLQFKLKKYMHGRKPSTSAPKQLVFRSILELPELFAQCSFSSNSSITREELFRNEASVKRFSQVLSDEAVE